MERLEARKLYSLNRDWHFKLGDHPIVEGKTHRDVYMFSKAGGKSGVAKAVYDDTDWELVTLPHDWVIGLDFDEHEVANHGYKPRGIGWYRKTFKLDIQDNDKSIYLEFGAISGEATIFFNVSVLGRNFSNYNSFVVDITERAHFGNEMNVIAIKVDATSWEGWWYEGAGIYRDVQLIMTSKLHVSHLGTWVNPEKIDEVTWMTKVETTIENTAYLEKSFTLCSQLYDQKGCCIARKESITSCKPGEGTVVSHKMITDNITLWDLKNPVLYTCRTKIYEDGELVDDYITTYGYRTIRYCSETGFYLNEQHVKIKGTCNHIDHAGLGVALPKSYW